MGYEMRKDERTQRPGSGSEKELLEAFLNFQRDTLLWKVSGLTEEQLRRVWTPSGMSLLGLVKHMADVERGWFQIRFAGRDLPLVRRPDDPDADFRFEPGETAESIIARYREEIAAAQQIVAEADSLETIAQSMQRRHSLRRILIHMIEETARHNGHADLMREQTDGAVGE